MRIPDSLTALAEEGIIDEVLRPLMSGKEAQVFLVRCGDDERVAKVYKDAEHRTFKQRAEYTEGRKVRNTRDQRALAKGSRYGREQDEATWRATEVDMIQRLHAAGIRVPTPYHFVDGVLIMELITDAEGNPAARLGDVQCDRATAIEIYDQLVREVVRMLCAGVVHGDLSDFNVLLDAAGPVIIDFPQAVNAAENASARKLLLRDVDNLHRWLTRTVPEQQPRPYAEEMWQLYQRGELTPDVKLTGRFRASEAKVDTNDLLGLVADAEDDERRRRQRLGLSGGPTARGEAPGLSSYARKKMLARAAANAPTSQRRDGQNNEQTQAAARGDANAPALQRRAAQGHQADARKHTAARGDAKARGAGEGRSQNKGHYGRHPGSQNGLPAKSSHAREAPRRDAHSGSQNPSRAKGSQEREAPRRDAHSGLQNPSRAKGSQEREAPRRDAHSGSQNRSPAEGSNSREASRRDAYPGSRKASRAEVLYSRDAARGDSHAGSPNGSPASSSHARGSPRRDAHSGSQRAPAEVSYAREAPRRDGHPGQQNAVSPKDSRRREAPRRDAYAGSQHASPAEVSYARDAARRDAHSGSQNTSRATNSQARETPFGDSYASSQNASPAKATHSREAPRRDSHSGSPGQVPEHARGNSRNGSPRDRIEPQPGTDSQRQRRPDQKPPGRR